MCTVCFGLEKSEIAFSRISVIPGTPLILDVSGRFWNYDIPKMLQMQAQDGKRADQVRAAMPVAPMEVAMEFYQSFYQILEDNKETKARDLAHLLAAWEYRLPEDSDYADSFESQDEYVHALLTESPAVIAVLLKAGFSSDLIFYEVLFSLDGYKGGDETGSDGYLAPTMENYPLATAADLERAKQILMVCCQVIDIPKKVQYERARIRRVYPALLREDGAVIEEWVKYLTV